MQHPARRTTVLLAGCLLGLGLLFARPSSLRADVDARALALGYQTERADVVAVGVVASGLDDLAADATRAKVVYDVRTLLRGGGGAKTLVVELAGDALAAVRGAPDVHLLFLTEQGAGNPLRPLTGAASVRVVPREGAGARLPDVVQSYVQALDAPEDRRAARLADVLVHQMGDADPGIAWSGATDFYRRGELAESLTTDGALRVVQAFESCTSAGRTKTALAMAMALAAHDQADEALARAIDADGADAIRGGLGDAAEQLARPELAANLAERLAGAPADRRLALLSVLGRVGRERQADAVLAFVKDADAGVRQEALHACGTIARNVRETARKLRVHGAPVAAERETDDDDDRTPPSPGTDAAAPREPASATDTWTPVRDRMRVALAQAALRATTKNDRRAALWALAQLDDPAAYGFLRDRAENARDDETRRVARSYLERPAQSLILR